MNHKQRQQYSQMKLHWRSHIRVPHSKAFPSIVLEMQTNILQRRYKHNRNDKIRHRKAPAMHAIVFSLSEARRHTQVKGNIPWRVARVRTR